MEMENENEETQKAPATDNGASHAEDLEAPALSTVEGIKAELEKEKKAKAAAEAALAEKDARIVELESALGEAKKASEATAAELASLKQVKDQAISKYLEAARALNSTIPQDVIVGQTVEEIDQAIEKGKALVEVVRKSLESQAKVAKVPAGAPTRGEISLEGLSPREKIAAGIQQKGGTQ
jgi:hypothetical protein